MHSDEAQKLHLTMIQDMDNMSVLNEMLDAHTAQNSDGVTSAFERLAEMGASGVRLLPPEDMHTDILSILAMFARAAQNDQARVMVVDALSTILT